MVINQSSQQSVRVNQSERLHLARVAGAEVDGVNYTSHLNSDDIASAINTYILHSTRSPTVAPPYSMNRNAEKAFEQRVARENCRNPPPITLSIALDPDDAPDDNATLVDSDDRKAQYDDIDWKRVPHLQIRDKEHGKGNPSWIYNYGWPLWHRHRQKRWWLCKYCHTHKMRGGEYDVHMSTSSAGTHLSANTPGHGYNRDGKINFGLPPNTSSIVHQLQFRGVEVSQEVANELASGFSQKKFRQALLDWIVADHQALRVIETPSSAR
ncbi:hypothetical protein BKA66DRAFT_438516 [Pyrenochaeta sp. MPI-SDFR-AT-0127]|nr:hypothetical protein BKA66DRAFT_438516 [Pyrenochaeta sp. MPI-SDFR-AT-0127]